MKTAETTAEPNTEPAAFRQFLRETAQCWRQLPDKALFFALLAAWLALFQFLGNSTLGYVKTHSLFGWMNFVYSTSVDDQHGFLVPWVVLVLFWWKRRELAAVPKTIWWPALALVVAGLLLHFVGFVIQQTRVSIAGFFIGLYGLTGLVWGRPWLRHTFFPFFLFAFCVPLAAIADPITFHLRILVAQIVTVIGHGLGIDVIRDGTQLFNAERTFGYDVVAACSGIRSLISLLALTTIFGFVNFRSPGKRLFMAVMAVPLAVLGNVLRISFVIVTAEALGQDAGAWVEQKFGFVTFAFAIACVLLLGRWLREPEEKPELSPAATPA